MVLVPDPVAAPADHREQGGGHGAARVGRFVIWLLLGIPVGVVSALRPRSRLDRAAMGIALVAVCIPVFFLGLASLYAFWFKLRLVPGTGYVSPARGVLPWLRQMLLPWTVLALLFAAFYARMGRATLMEVLGEDYVSNGPGQGAERAQGDRQARLPGQRPPPRDDVWDGPRAALREGR